MRMISILLVACALRLNAAPSASTNDIPPGPLRGLCQLAVKSADEDRLPPALGALLWPGNGNHSVLVREFPVPAEHESRVFIYRPDNHDIILLHRVEIMPNESAKKRTEYYFRTSPGGQLTLVVCARFTYDVDDVDNELLKKKTTEIYSNSPIDGQKVSPISPELISHFEAEKKFWRSQEKKLRKAQRLRKE